MESSASASTDRAARLRRTSGLLTRRIRAEAQGVSGLTIQQEWVVSLLMDAPEGLSSAELARAQGVTAQTMSVAVAAMETLGMLRASRDPDDGRRRILQPTESGVDALERSLDVKQRWLSEVLAEFSEAELTALDTGLDLLDRIVES